MTPLSELQQPDERTLRFNPYGLGGRVDPEDAGRYQVATIGRDVLAGDVPQDVHNNFERARKLHFYGVLEYEFFTVAADYALLSTSIGSSSSARGRFDRRCTVAGRSPGALAGPGRTLVRGDLGHASRCPGARERPRRRSNGSRSDMLGVLRPHRRKIRRRERRSCARSPQSVKARERCTGGAVSRPPGAREVRRQPPPTFNAIVPRLSTSPCHARNFAQVSARPPC